MSNRVIVSMGRIWQGLRVLLVLTVLFALLVRSGISAENDAGESTDHPLMVITGASVHRMLDRAVEITQSCGIEMTREQIFEKIQADANPTSLQEVEKWFDCSRPFGLMFFFNLDPVGEPEVKPNAPVAEKEENVDGDAKPAREATVTRTPGLMDLVDTMDDADFSRVVFFIPVKDFNLFLQTAKLTPVAGKPNCYRDGEGKESYVRRIGDYVIGSDDASLVENCPDPRSLSRSILGKNDVAASVQLKGLPPLLRSLGAEGIKAAYDASLQQRDEEPEREYQLRRATGDLIREILDLMVSHIDEITLGARLESKSKQAIVELELSGEKGGELSKSSAELTPRRLPFSSVVKPDSGFSLDLALPLPERHAKPIAAAIRNYVATAKDAEASLLEEYVSLIEFGCKILDSRQLDMIVFDKDGVGTSGLIGIAVPGGPQFPQQFQQFLDGAKGETKLELAVDELNGWPVHRLQVEDGISILNLLMGADFELVKETSVQFWIVASPQAVWLGSAPKSDGDRLPDFMKSAIELHAKRAPNPQKNFRGNPLRMSLHTRQWMNLPFTEPVLPQADDPERQKEIQQMVEQTRRDHEARVASYEGASDELVFELQPSPNGWKLNVQLDEVYLRLMSLSLPVVHVNRTPVGAPAVEKSEK